MIPANHKITDEEIDRYQIAISQYIQSHTRFNIICET